jgi:hypothetical protein
VQGQGKLLQRLGRRLRTTGFVALYLLDQLKLHLSRLADLEYLAVHRRGTAFDYELLYDGKGDGKHLCGLLDAAELERKDGYDGERSGCNTNRAEPGRVEVGPWLADGRPARHHAQSQQPCGVQGDEDGTNAPFAPNAHPDAIDAGPVVAGN